MRHIFLIILTLSILSAPAQAKNRHSGGSTLTELEAVENPAENVSLLNITAQNKALIKNEPLFMLAATTIENGDSGLSVPDADSATLLVLHTYGNGPRLTGKKRSLPWQLYKQMDKKLLRALLSSDGDDSSASDDENDEENELSPELRSAIKEFIKKIFKNYDDTYYYAHKRANSKKNYAIKLAASAAATHNVPPARQLTLDLEEKCLAAVTNNRIDLLYNNLQKALNDLLILLLKEHKEPTCQYIKNESWVAHKALCLNLSGRLGQLYNDVTKKIIDEFVNLLITKLITNNFFASHGSESLTICNDYANLDTLLFTGLPTGTYQLNIAKNKKSSQVKEQNININLQAGQSYLLQISN